MKIFVAGATEALGRRLVLLLVSNGHTVVGTTRAPATRRRCVPSALPPWSSTACDRGGCGRSGPCRSAAGRPVGKHQFDWERSRS